MGEKFLTASNVAVLCACCTFSFFIQGVCRLSGLIFMVCITQYNVGREEASIPFAISNVVGTISGPLIGFLGKKFSSELLIASGCTLSTIGVGACFFAEDITGIIVCWGGIFGLGLGFALFLAHDILHSNFGKHYGKATGIYLTGEGLGGFILPLYAEKMLSIYGASGTFLLLSGLMLHTIPAAMILLNLHRRKATITTSRRRRGILNDTKDNSFAKSKPSVRYEEAHKDEDEYVSLTELPESERMYRDDGQVLDDGQLNISNTCVDNAKQNIFVIKDLKTPFASFKLFLNPVFIIIFVTQSSMIFVVATLYTVIIDFSKDIGVSEDQEKYILMAVAIGDLLGRLTLGHVIDAGWMSKANFYSMFLILFGALVACFTTLDGFNMMVLGSFAAGLLIAGQMVISPGIVSLYIDKSQFKLAVSSRFILFPLMALAQPVLIAFFRETRGSYNGLLFFIAGLDFLCGILVRMIPVTKRVQENKRKLTREKDDSHARKVSLPSSFKKSETDEQMKS